MGNPHISGQQSNFSGEKNVQWLFDGSTLLACLMLFDVKGEGLRNEQASPTHPIRVNCGLGGRAMGLHTTQGHRGATGGGGGRVHQP